MSARQAEIVWKFSIISILPTMQNPYSHRRFPPPRSIDELEACFVVIDSAGQNPITPNERLCSWVRCVMRWRPAADK
jgi:hypothetical protein